MHSTIVSGQLKQVLLATTAEMQEEQIFMYRHRSWLFNVVSYMAASAVLLNGACVLYRSSFLGTGAVAAHWTGDNAATWADLR